VQAERSKWNVAYTSQRLIMLMRTLSCVQSIKLATVYTIDAAAPYRIAIVARPRGGDWLCDELSALFREGIDVLVSMLTEEESKELGLEKESEYCEGTAITFVNLPIPDRSVPSDTNDFLGAVEQLAQLVREGRFGIL
jgi:hypothetical protein